MGHLHFAQHVFVIDRVFKGFSEQVIGLLELRFQMRDPRSRIKELYRLIIADCNAFNGHEHYHPGLFYLFIYSKPNAPA